MGLLGYLFLSRRISDVQDQLYRQQQGLPPRPPNRLLATPALIALAAVLGTLLLAFLLLCLVMLLPLIQNSRVLTSS